MDILVARCAIEPDFYVRDMLTWALMRSPSDVTVPRLLAELRSLSRALIALGEEVIEPVLRKAMASGTAEMQAHASATERLLHDPNGGSELAIHEAKRQFVLGTERKPE